MSYNVYTTVYKFSFQKIFAKILINMYTDNNFLYSIKCLRGSFVRKLDLRVHTINEFDSNKNYRVYLPFIAIIITNHKDYDTFTPESPDQWNKFLGLIQKDDRRKDLIFELEFDERFNLLDTIYLWKSILYQDDIYTSINDKGKDFETSYDIGRIIKIKNGLDKDNDYISKDSPLYKYVTCFVSIGDPPTISQYMKTLEQFLNDVNNASDDDLIRIFITKNLTKKYNNTILKIIPDILRGKNLSPQIDIDDIIKLLYIFHNRLCGGDKQYKENTKDEFENYIKSIKKRYNPSDTNSMRKSTG